MDLYYIDYISVSGTSWLHRLPTALKLLALVAVIAVTLSISSFALYVTILLGMILLAISARLPLGTYFALTAYPLLFLALIFFSIDGLTWFIAVVLTSRVLAITATVILVLLTTSYPAIFGTLGRILPGVLVAAFFFTYRSLFIISKSIANARIVLHLRGGLSWRHPYRSLRNMGNALAHILVHAIETSQRMAESLVVRGFNNRIYYLENNTWHRTK
ncbi:MAG TPA: CbiQ family ECF transporter T component [Armatimonadota bacterium]|nr:CbiQ family ECF transporter T component [Armatimonadota bacterium]